MGRSRPFLPLLLFLLYLPALAAPPGLLDDFNDPARNGAAVSQRANLWGGGWAITHTGGSSLSVSFTAPGKGGGMAAGVRGYTGARGDWSILQCPLIDWMVPYNAACHGFQGVRFLFKGDGKTYRIEVPSQAVTDKNYYGSEIHSSYDWEEYRLPFEEMTRSPGWGSQPDLPQNPDAIDLVGFQVFPRDPGDFQYSLDDVSFYGNYVPNCPGTPGIPSGVPSSIPNSKLRITNSNWSPTPILPMGTSAEPKQGDGGSPVILARATARVPKDRLDTPTPGNYGLPTPTPIRSYCPPKMLDDFELGDPDRAEDRTDLWGGRWSLRTSRGGRVAAALFGPGAEGSLKALGLSGKGTGSTEPQEAAAVAELAPGGGSVDLLEQGYNAVRFYLRSDGNTYWLDFHVEGEEGEAVFSYMMNSPKGTWFQFNVPFRNLNRIKKIEGGEEVELFRDWSQVTAIGFRSRTNKDVSLGLDQVAFYCDPSIPLPPHPPRRPKRPTPPPAPTATPLPTETPVPPTLVPTRRALPTLTPIPPPPTWTPWPTPPPPAAHRESWPLSTPTRAWVFKRAATPTPIPRKVRWIPTPLPKAPVRPTPPRLALPTATPPPDWMPPLDLSASVTFLAPPANIFVVFADGAGRYRLTVVDAKGRTMEVVYEAWVPGRREDWVTWDGKDGKGAEAPPGRYYLLLFKDGKPLKGIPLFLAGGS